MMRHFVRATSTIITLAITLAVLLAVVVGLAQAHQVRPGPGKVTSADDAEQAEDTALVCLALVGGTALLAGVVWMRKLRWLLP